MLTRPAPFWIAAALICAATTSRPHAFAQADTPSGDPSLTAAPRSPGSTDPSPTTPTNQPEEEPVLRMAPDTTPEAPANPAAASPPANDDEDPEHFPDPVPSYFLGTGECLLGDFCIGPVISLGLLNPMGAGVHLRYGRYLGFGIDYHVLPTVTISDVSANASLFTVAARLYPTGGSLFISAGLAFQHFAARGSVQAVDADNPADPTVSIDVEGSIDVTALKLGIGFMGHDGLVVGVDLALHIPLGARRLRFSTSGDFADSAEVEEVEDDIRDAGGDAIEDVPVLVQVNLIRIGYLF